MIRANLLSGGSFTSEVLSSGFSAPSLTLTKDYKCIVVCGSAVSVTGTFTVTCGGESATVSTQVEGTSQIGYAVIEDAKANDTLVANWPSTRSGYIIIGIY